MNSLLRSFAVFALAATAGIVLSRTGADIAWLRPYFTSSEGWIHADDTLPQALYNYGPWPAIGLAIGGLLLGVKSLFGPARSSSHTRRLWFFPLLMILGPGLLVNAVGKDNWGRPRPKQIQEFDGPATYITAGAIGPVAKDRKSFPSGHASMGFYLMAGYFVFRGRRTALAIASLGAGLGMGAAIGWARMVQGGHFPSDVIWAGAVVFISGELLACLLLRTSTSRSDNTPTSSSRTSP